MDTITSDGWPRGFLFAMLIKICCEVSKCQPRSRVTACKFMIFTCSLFIGLCSVTAHMTGYSVSYHSIKLIHCSALQRNVLSDKMVFWMANRSFYFMLCQSSLLSTVISFVYKDKWWFDESMSVIFFMENIWKIIILFPLHIELNLKTLLCNWRGSPARKGLTAWKALFKKE